MIEFKYNERLGLNCYGHTAGLLRFGDKPFWTVTFEKYGQKFRHPSRLRMDFNSLRRALFASG